MRARSKLAVFGLLLVAAGCNSKASGSGAEGSAQPSPNASIFPAPLADAGELAAAARTDGGRVALPADSAGRLILPEAGSPEPTPIREDEPLPRDTLTTKDGTGVTLEAQFKWLDVPNPANLPEISNDGLKKAREKTALAVSIDLAPAGRMRFVFGSPSFPVPKNAELRAAVDHWGQILVWPDGNAYRILRPGTLRALFAERRADALPLIRPKPEARGKGNYLGLETTKLGLTTQVGSLSLELANVPNTAHSGELLCRLLIDLVAVDPQSKVCPDGMTPLRAEYRWPQGSRPALAFDVSTIARRPELPVGLLFFPPAGADFKTGELPPQSSGVLLGKDELAALRTKPISVEGQIQKDAPGEGVIAVNRTDSLRYLLLDGVPVAWVKPQSQQPLIGPLSGRYLVSWRDFLSSAVEPPKTVALPARVSVGAEPDAGAPEKK